MDNNIQDEHIHARVIPELIELKKKLKARVLLTGELEDESKELYNHIIATLYQAYGELYGINQEENNDQEKKPETDQD